LSWSNASTSSLGPLEKWSEISMALPSRAKAQRKATPCPEMALRRVRCPTRLSPSDPNVHPPWGEDAENVYGEQRLRRNERHISDAFSVRPMRKWSAPLTISMLMLSHSRRIGGAYACR